MLCNVVWQDIKTVHHAVLYEYLLYKHKKDEKWQDTIAHFLKYFKSIWPVDALGEPDEEPKTFPRTLGGLELQVCS